MERRLRTVGTAEREWEHAGTMSRVPRAFGNADTHRICFGYCQGFGTLQPTRSHLATNICSARRWQEALLKCIKWGDCELSHKQ